ncbi:MAG: ABC transporter substrate-binding protein, partial [Ruegeria sp.]
MRNCLTPLFAALIWCALAISAAAVEVKAAVLRIDYQTLLPISRYDLRPDDLGFAGAVLADEDNGTTGGFLGHTYETAHIAAPPEQADAAMDQILADGVGLVVVLANAEDLLRLTDKAAEAGALVFNATAPDTALRDGECRGNLLHIAPSRAMNADAVAQFAVWKKWGDWFLIAGSNPADVALAEAFRRSAVKFGAEIVEDRTFEDTGGSRRTDSGHVLVQRQLPLDTQDASDHDVVIAADETDYFARYLSYHIWTPRPVMGAGGLRPVAFHSAHEAWGATQFQTRFEELAGRYVRPEGYNTWLALRVVGEAGARGQNAGPHRGGGYCFSEGIRPAAVQGPEGKVRDWEGALGPAIPLFGR